MVVEYRRDVPLTMGDKLIGKIHFDKDTGEISGRLMDTVMIDMLNELFEGHLLDVSFLGKPANQSKENISAINAKLRAYLKGEINDKSTTP